MENEEVRGCKGTSLNVCVHVLDVSCKYCIWSYIVCMCVVCVLNVFCKYIELCSVYVCVSRVYAYARLPVCTWSCVCTSIHTCTMCVCMSMHKGTY